MVIVFSIPIVAAANQDLTQITCTLSPNLGFGSGNGTFTRGNFGGDFTPPDFGSGNFTPPQFGDGNFSMPEMFGDGTFTLPSGFVGGSTLMNETLYADIRYVDGVVGVVPILQVSEGQNPTVGALDQNFSLVVPDYLIVGVPLDSSAVNDYPVLPTNITAGRNLQAGDSGVVLLSENNSEFFGVGVGDTVTILGQSFEVVGVYGSSGIADATSLYMALSDAQTLTNNTGYISRLEVFVASSDVAEVTLAISSLHPELSVVTPQQFLYPTSSASPNPTSLTQSTSEQISSGSLDFFYPALVVVVVAVIVAAAFVLRKRRKAGSATSSLEGHAEFSGKPFSFLSCIASTLLSHLFSYVGEKTAFFKSTLSVMEKSEICKYRKIVKKEFASKCTKEVLT
jgi:hypothetical protein